MPNEEQIAYWNGDRGRSWVADQELRDRTLAPFGEAALRRAEPRPGERAVDVGCGCGASVLALAAAVGPTGHVLGIDVSQPMLGRARVRAAGLAQVELRCADAASHPFDGRADLLYSRFGVMFFDDPPAAFSNLRRALAPGRRLAFACWRSLAENEWMAVPAQAVRAVLPEAPALPSGPGPLSLADPALLRALLAGAGFAEIVLEPFDHPIPLGQGRGLDAAAAEAVTLGPAARLLAQADEATRSAALAAVRAALAPLLRGERIELGGGAWLVSARASG
ncbi:MAG: class I SAM-dependent methyltransferase [Myxococcales bacterium]